MFSLKKSSAFVIAFAAISFFPLAACAGEKGGNLVTESKKEVEGKELKSVKIKLHGNKGKKTLEGDYDEVEIDASGSTDLVMKGTANSVEVDVSGSADIDLSELDAETVDLNLSGSADVHVKANKSFKINASGSGHLYLYGKGSIKRQSYTGSVKVHDKRKG